MNKLATVFIGTNFDSPFGQTKSLGDLVSLILEGSFAIAGVLLLFLIIFAGFSMIAGAGSNNPEQSAKGKKAATAAVIGFAIVFGAYLIIQLIELLLGSNPITQPGI